MNIGVLQEPTRPSPLAAATGRFVAAGIVLGLAWGASLRTWMTLGAIASGSTSTYSWGGTFGRVLLPAGIIGGVLGWAEHARRTGGRRYWRYTALTPLLFIVINMLFVPVATLFRTGGGVVGGAVAVVLVGLGGGFAFSGRGPLWARLSAGVPAVGLVGLIAFGLTTDIEANSSQEALPSFAGLTFALLMVLWVAACSISHKKVAPTLPRRIYRGHLVDVTHKSTQSERSGKT